MKQVSLHILLIFMLPLLVVAQEYPAENTIAFYTQLAQRDAAYEYHMSLKALEDEQDFWKDQIHFEEQLSKNNPRGYDIYLRTKSKSYRSYQKECAGACVHSEHYLRRAAFYVVNAQPESELAFSTEIKKPQSKD